MRTFRLEQRILDTIGGPLSTGAAESLAVAPSSCIRTGSVLRFLYLVPLGLRSSDLHPGAARFELPSVDFGHHHRRTRKAPVIMSENGEQQTRPSRDNQYSMIVVGTGFASTFFLWQYLQRAKLGARILVLEMGRRMEHRDQLGLQMKIFESNAGTFINRTPEKAWIFGVLFGGGSNYWMGNSPRHLPEDFALHSRYGVGWDWPLSYDELERFYCDAEELMGISGPSDDAPAPRSRPYPHPPHRMNDPDRLLKKAFPNQFFSLPSARPTRPTGRRPKCCANGVCYLCPVNAKFTIMNEVVGDVYRDPRVSLLLGAQAEIVEWQGDRATGVTYRHGGKLHSARGDLVVLGANAVFNPHLLLRSGVEHQRLGRGLCEQVGVAFDVHLDGVDNFQGSTLHTGHGYMLYRGDHRRERAAALIETWNAPPLLRMERGKWRQRMLIKAIFEDLPQEKNYVRPSPGEPEKPETWFVGHSDYARRGLAALPGELERIFSHLPVEQIRRIDFPISSESHIQCTTPMGRDPQTSIVDRFLVHHRLRNLLVLGSSVFPTCPPANPTLTLTALSLWAAHHLTASAK